MKLFFSPGACSLAPHIVLREAGTPFTVEQVNLGKHVTAAGGDYYAVTPKGQVPLLELDDGALLSEGPIICQYIADQAGNTTLMPAAGSMARYRVMEWQNYITAELHKGFSPLFNPAFAADAKELHAQMLRKKFVWVDSKLAGRDYLTGSDFTAADAYLFTVSGWAPMVKLDLSDLAHLQAFRARVAARPAVRQAMQAEGLIPA